MKHYWLVKSEPDAYSWSDLVKEKKTSWTGVRNFKARNNLRSMRVGDEVLFYHSVNDKAVVNAVIKENLIADTHAAEIISRLEIADAGPTSFLFFDQIAPRIGIWF